MPYHEVLCRVMRCVVSYVHVVLWRVVSYVVSFRVLRRVVSCHEMLCVFMKCRVVPCHEVFCRVMKCRVMS